MPAGLILALMAAEVMGPVPVQPIGDASKWLGDNDYPVDAIRKGRGGSVTVDFFVAPDGTNEKCVVVVSSGAPVLDNAVCALLMKRAKFGPARDGNGHPTYGVARRRTNWLLNVGDRPKTISEKPDYVFGVVALPDQAQEYAEVDVVVEIDEAGKLKTCLVPPPSDQKLLANVACRQLRATWEPAPEADRAGKPIGYVRVQDVGFIVTGATATTAPTR